MTITLTIIENLLESYDKVKLCHVDPKLELIIEGLDIQGKSNTMIS